MATFITKDVSERQDRRLLFVLRCASWHGVCTRNDVCDTFGISPTQGTSVLKGAVRKYASVLENRPGKKGVFLRAGQPRHPQAYAQRIFSLVAQGDVTRADLGFRPEGIFATLRQSPVGAGGEHGGAEERLGLERDGAGEAFITAELLRAAFLERTVDIQYVSLRPGAVATWRAVRPLSFEIKGHPWPVWQMRALDMEGSPPFLTKAFLLARILGVRPSEAYQGKVEPSYTPVKAYRVTLNAALTSDQVRVVRRELRLDLKDYVHLSDEDMFEFRRRYCDQQMDLRAPRREGVVWPLVATLELVETRRERTEA